MELSSVHTFVQEAPWCASATSCQVQRKFHTDDMDFASTLNWYNTQTHEHIYTQGLINRLTHV